MTLAPSPDIGSFIRQTSNKVAKLVVEVSFHGEIIIRCDGQAISIMGANVSDAFWLSDALRAAGEMSKKRPLQ